MISAARIKINTWNARSFRSQSQGAGLAQNYKAHNARALLEQGHINLFQETNFNPLEVKYLDRCYPPGPSKFRSLYSNIDSETGGVATVISPEVLRFFKPLPIDLHPSLQGRAQITLFTPITPGLSFVVVNLHLDHTGSYNLKIQQLNHIEFAIPEVDYLYLGGDLNFVENRNRDTTSTNKDPLPQHFIQAWARFLDLFNLKEVVQNTHTFFKDGTDPYSARLDRLFTSHSETDWALYKPFSYISYIPHTFLYSRLSSSFRHPPNPNEREGNPPSLPHSDHLPVSLSYGDDPPREPIGPSIPSWVPESPGFQEAVEDSWARQAPALLRVGPFELLEALKRTLYRASSEVLASRNRDRKAYSTDLSDFMACIKAIRFKEQEPSSSSEDFFTRNPDLASLNTTGLRARIDDLLKSGGIEAKARNPGASSVRKPNLIKKIKLTLPSTRKRIQALRLSLSSSLTSDPDEMASMAADFWSKIWAPRPVTDESISPDEYFGDYSNPIPRDLLPSFPTVEETEDSIRGTNDSSPGPDGIPFSAWRAIAQIAALVLWGVLRALADGVEPPEGFNFGLLFLIPKKGLLTVDDTRPISVTNADNRIIAKIVVKAIGLTLFAHLHKAQKGFVPGRVFEEHLRELNEFFYSMVEGMDDPLNPLFTDRNFFILFMDTAKAFDSVDHSFILESIRRIGMPDWFLRLVKGLLHCVRVRPAFRGAQDHWIPISRGVKQGCPLSPLLFVICYDVLLWRISRFTKTTPYACADDLALSATSFWHFWAAMREVDRFSLASGFGLNRDKTLAISARPSNLALHLPSSPWPLTKEAPHTVYLGILFGRLVTTKDVYEKALNGLVERATLFNVSIKALSHHNRVITVNVFITTKLSYLIKFFTLPFTAHAKSCAEGVVKEVVRGLILRYGGKGTAYPYCYLVTLSDQVSPGPPLRDLWAVGTSTLATSISLDEWDGLVVAPTFPEAAHSLRMSLHAKAAGVDLVSYIWVSSLLIPPSSLATSLKGKGK